MSIKSFVMVRRGLREALLTGGLALCLFFLCVEGGVTQGYAGQQGMHTQNSLPVPVRRMVDEIRQAAQSGEVERLREVLQLNELQPVINGKVLHDPVTFWKQRSADHKAYALLATLVSLLRVPPCQKKTKSGMLYLWPYFACVPLDRLRPAEKVRFYELVPAQKAAQMLRKKRYGHAVLTIGADGTWHSYEDHIKP